MWLCELALKQDMHFSSSDALRCVYSTGLTLSYQYMQCSCIASEYHELHKAIEWLLLSD
jgi:hypothetical protein